MKNCHNCGTRLVTSVLPEHTEHFGGMQVVLKNCVLLHRCPKCGEKLTDIQESRNLYQAAVLARVMLPIQLSGKDIRFFRSVFDMTQADFAEASGFDSAETISRWENASVTGAYAEKLLRYAVHARLHKAMPATSYDPEDIAKMKIRPLAEGEMPMLVASLKMMRVSDPGGRTKRVIVYQIEDQIADRPTWT